MNNFAATLPSPQSDLAQQTLKDPYLFDFLTLHDDAVERDLESGLVDHIQRFLVELGAGFAFVGRQVHLLVGKDDFYIDLLFYHLTLRLFRGHRLEDAKVHARARGQNELLPVRHRFADAPPRRRTVHRAHPV